MVWLFFFGPSSASLHKYTENIQLAAKIIRTLAIMLVIFCCLTANFIVILLFINSIKIKGYGSQSTYFRKMLYVWVLWLQIVANSQKILLMSVTTMLRKMTYTFDTERNSLIRGASILERQLFNAWKYKYLK